MNNIFFAFFHFPECSIANLEFMLLFTAADIKDTVYKGFDCFMPKCLFYLTIVSALKIRSSYVILVCCVSSTKI